jgi:DNA-directed RNA polymerase specialized sigma24 family protein
LEGLCEQDTGPLQLVAVDALPDVVVASDEGVSNIRTHIDALPDANVREPTSLFFLGEHSYAEIAESLGRPLGTVKNQIYRGRKALQEGLRPWVDGGST